MLKKTLIFLQVIVFTVGVLALPIIAPQKVKAADSICIDPNIHFSDSLDFKTFDAKQVKTGDPDYPWGLKLIPGQELTFFVDGQNFGKRCVSPNKVIYNTGLSLTGAITYDNNIGIVDLPPKPVWDPIQEKFVPAYTVLSNTVPATNLPGGTGTMPIEPGKFGGEVKIKVSPYIQTGIYHFVFVASYLTTTISPFVQGPYYWSQEMSYTNQIPFYVEGPGVPTVSTLPATNITDNSAIINGSIDKTGEANVVARGFKYKEKTAAVWITPTVQSSSAFPTGQFNKTLSGLLPNTAYQFKAYADNNIGRGEGGVLEFTTMKKIDPPAVLTNPATNPTQTSATLNGDVTGNGGGTVSSRGFDWYSSANCLGTKTSINDGSGLGKFDENLTGLTADKDYSYKAFATNEAGTAYGACANFQTLAELPPNVDVKVDDQDNVTVPSGSNIVVKWSTSNADSCTSSGDLSGTTITPNTNGSRTYSSVTAPNKTCTVTCSNAYGQASDSATATISASGAITGGRRIKVIVDWDDFGVKQSTSLSTFLKDLQ